jgi:DNA-binding IscR family transcriptional regulator
MEEKNKPEPIYDEEHAFNEAMNKMLEDFSEEEIQDLIDESKSKDPKDEV